MKKYLKTIGILSTLVALVACNQTKALTEEEGNKKANDIGAYVDDLNNNFSKCFSYSYEQEINYKNTSHEYKRISKKVKDEYHLDKLIFNADIDANYYYKFTYYKNIINYEDGTNYESEVTEKVWFYPVDKEVYSITDYAETRNDGIAPANSKTYTHFKKDSKNATNPIERYVAYNEPYFCFDGSYDKTFEVSLVDRVLYSDELLPEQLKIDSETKYSTNGKNGNLKCNYNATVSMDEKAFKELSEVSIRALEDNRDQIGSGTTIIKRTVDVDEYLYYSINSSVSDEIKDLEGKEFEKQTCNTKVSLKKGCDKSKPNLKEFVDQTDFY